jgi:outer membrane protein
LLPDLLNKKALTMKRLPLILNIALAIAVAVLYFLHFTGMGSCKKNLTGEGLTGGIASGSNIYYVQIDSVLSHFDMATDLSSELQTKYSASESEFQAKQKSYQNDVNDYQYKTQRGLVTRSEAQTIEQQLYAKQQNLVKLQQDLSQELTEKQTVMNRQVINAIMEYLKKNSSQFNYKYVLGSSFGGNILYANDSLDITHNIIQGLNTNYRQTRKKAQ